MGWPRIPCGCRLLPVPKSLYKLHCNHFLAAIAVVYYRPFLSSFSSSGYHATFAYLQARPISASYLWIVMDFFVANVVDAFIEKAR